MNEEGGMDVNKKWVSFFMFVGFLSSTVIHPAISIAVSQGTQNSQSQTEASTNTLTTMSSDVLGAPNETADSEEEPIVEAQEQEIYAEKNYDERDLSKKDEENGSQPFVQAEIDQKGLSGEIQRSSESSDESTTILEKVALQTKTKDTGWQEVTVFKESTDHILNESNFIFELKDILEEQDYRLIVDYEIEVPNEEQSVV